MSGNSGGKVTLGDVTVSQDDLMLLLPPAWLNDTLLSFWCEHVQSVGNGEKDTSVQILQPNLSYFLLLSEDAQDAVRELDLGSKRLVIALVNNTLGMTTGTHWSVLCYSRSADAFYHYDSALNTNSSYARRLALVLSEPIGTVNPPEYFDTESPRQPNSFMCGDYSCAFVSLLIDRFKKGEDPPRNRIDLLPAAQHAKRIRYEIMNAVRQLESVDGAPSAAVKPVSAAAASNTTKK